MKKTILKYAFLIAVFAFMVLADGCGKGKTENTKTDGTKT